MKYMRALLVGILWALSAQAQFTEIAATDDGSQVYVTTGLVIDDVNGPARPRIFRIADGKVSLFAEADAGQSLPGFFLNTGPTVSGPQVSADGSVAGYSITNLCRENLCSSDYAESYLKLPGDKDLGAGSLYLSRNGRWALVATPSTFRITGSATLIDLENGTTTDIPVGPSGNFAVASDGSVMAGGNIWKAGQAISISSASPFGPLALSDDASTVIGLRIILGAAPGVQVIAHDVASGRETVLYDSSVDGGVLSRQVSVSGNGRFVLFSVVGPSAASFVGDTVTGEKYRVALDDGETMVAGVLNGPGTRAFIATSMGRLLQVTLAGAQPVAVTPILPAPVFLGVMGSVAASGSLVRMTGSVTGTADSLQGRILLDHIPMPILAVNGNQVTAQVPWEVTAGPKSLEIDLPNASPFHLAASSVQVVSGAPRLELAEGAPAILGIKMVAEDFSGLAVNPLPAGAVVHVYMTGLGAVQGAVQTGVPADPVNLNPIQGKITCRFLPQSSDARTLFAGLAPGLTGVYQVDFMLADEGAPVTVNGLRCNASGPGFSSSFSVIGLGGQ